MQFSEKSIGLVLSGGGARGFFHIGVLKAIQELNIKIDKISGTSVGAVIGAIYAAKPQTDFDKLTSELDFFKVTKTIALGTKSGTTSGIESFIKKHLSATDFSELKIPLSFNATDINNKEEVVFNKGPLFPALISSISIPGVFPPVKIGERFLIDGGVANNVPASLVTDTTDLIISDITGPVKKIDSSTSPLKVLYSSITFMQYRIKQEELNKIKNQKVTHLKLLDNNIFLLDFRKKNFKKLIDLGYNAMMNSDLAK
jgi:NTE family protein